MSRLLLLLFLRGLDFDYSESSIGLTMYHELIKAPVVATTSGARPPIKFCPFILELVTAAGALHIKQSPLLDLLDAPARGADHISLTVCVGRRKAFQAGHFGHSPLSTIPNILVDFI